MTRSGSKPSGRRRPRPARGPLRVMAGMNVFRTLGRQERNLAQGVPERRHATLKEYEIMRVPYPLDFYSRGMNRLRGRESERKFSLA